MESPRLEYVPRYTYNDYELWEGRWELISGIPFSMTPAPIIKHQEVIGNIFNQLSQLLHKCKKCKPIISPCDWKINEDTVIQPDVMIICSGEKGKYLTKPPIVIFEVLSESSSIKDRRVKFDLYESQGVRYYSIVDLKLRIAEAYQIRQNVYKKIIETKTDKIVFDLNICKINFDFGKIW